MSTVLGHEIAKEGVSSTKVVAPPGGASSICFGGDPEPVRAAPPRAAPAAAVPANENRPAAGVAHAPRNQNTSQISFGWGDDSTPAAPARAAAPAAAAPAPAQPAATQNYQASGADSVTGSRPSSRVVAPPGGASSITFG